ncbi:hypothetical protein AH06_198 [Erwinia phage AH06]|nr:hypothetical protein AH06_198 [Erwinia phage AH06]
MKVLTLSEFSEFLVKNQGKKLPTFSVTPGNILTGDNHISVFFKQEEGVNYLAEYTYNKPVAFTVIKDKKLNALIQSKLPPVKWGADYLLAINFKFDTIVEFSAAHEMYVKPTLQDFILKMVDNIPTADTVVMSDDISPDRVERVALEPILNQANYINLSFISFVWENDTHMVIAKGFREEVVLDLVRYDAEKRHAFFSGIVAGKPIYQRVVIDEVMFKGDRDFLKWTRSHNPNNGGSLWWVRHMGVSLHDESNSLTLKNPHISVRGQMQMSQIPSHYDFVNNRNVIL